MLTNPAITSAKMMDFLRDFVDNMEDRGLIFVPITPTPQMLSEGAEIANISIEQARLAYRAMLNVASPEIEANDAE